ncbi:thioesterase family protein [bacterium]|nr:thioesterase family protein [bacterium]
MPRTKLKLPAKFQFSTNLTVRVSDVNYAKHLSNDKVLAFMHEARARYLNHFGFTEMDVDCRGTIQTETVIIYKSEAFHGDKLRIEITPDDFHKYGCDFYYLITAAKTGSEVARGKTGLVFFDYTARKITQVPSKFIEKCGQAVQTDRNEP